VAKQAFSHLPLPNVGGNSSIHTSSTREGFSCTVKNVIAHAPVPPQLSCEQRCPMNILGHQAIRRLDLNGRRLNPDIDVKNFFPSPLTHWIKQPSAFPRRAFKSLGQSKETCSNRLRNGIVRQVGKLPMQLCKLSHAASSKLSSSLDGATTFIIMTNGINGIHAPSLC
jgi:hypothetical protein